MITEEQITNNPDMVGEYNVIRYLTNFNKRIEPLLVVFNPEIRDNIIVENPNDRQYFTKHQCELVSGFPLKESGQDNINEIMTLSDTEVSFWNKVQIDPFYMYVEDSINHIDKKWVEHNRKVLLSQENSTKDSDEDDIIETDGHDFSIVDLINGDI